MTRTTLRIAAAVLLCATAARSEPQDDQAAPSSSSPAEEAIPLSNLPGAPSQAAEPIKASALPGMSIQKAPQAPVAAPPPAAACPDPGAKRAEKPLEGCSAPLRRLAEGYRKASEILSRWAEEASGQVAAAARREKEIAEKIRDNEAAVTKAKLDRDKARIKELSRENKDLWRALESAQQERSAVCRALGKTAGEKHKELTAELKTLLGETQAEMR